MRAGRIYISTIAKDDAAVAGRYGFGLEIAEYCTAYNMDEHYAQTDAALREKLCGIPRRIFHAPFNELFPCAIDPKARELAAYRFRQAINLARQYGAEKVVFHGGYNPRIYYPVWYVEQSIVFWQNFLMDDPGVEIVLENVLEEEPEMLLNIVRGVDNPCLRLCLDIGHVNTYSEFSVEEWLQAWSPYLSHLHIHNNDGSWDTHSALDQGNIPMERLLGLADRLCPDATFTLEVMQAQSSVQWLLDRKII